MFQIVENKRFKNWLPELALILLAFLTFLFIAFPLIQLGTEHLRVVEAFNVDEGEFLWPVSEAFRRGDFNIGRYDYGLLYYNLGLILCYVLNMFVTIDNQIIIQLFRFESFFFLTLSALVMMRIAKPYLGSLSLFGLGITILLGSITLLNYGTMLHPDTCQMFFIVGAVYFAMKFNLELRLNSILISAAFAGFAFSVKFAGIAFMPMIVILIFIQPIQQVEKWPRQWKFIALGLLAGSWALFLNKNWISSHITQEAEIVSLLFGIIDVARIISILVVLLAILGFFFTQSRFLSRTLDILLLQVLSVTSFFGAFILGSPQAAYKFNFLNGFIYVTNLHKDGHWFKDDRGLMGWFDMLVQQDVFGWVLILIALVGMSWAIVDVASKISKSNLRFGLVIPLGWVMLFLIVIVFRVKSKFAHYLIPIIPFLGFYVWYALESIMKKKGESSSVKKDWILGPLVIFSLMFFSTKVWSYKNDRVEAFRNSPSMAAGNWISENIKLPVFILADKYSYIPPMENIKHITVFGMVSAHFTQFDPDILVIQPIVYNRFIGNSKREEYLYGQDVFDDRNSIYNALLADEFEGYKLVQSFEGVKIYQKQVTQ